ncbi:MAG: sugar transferase [Chlorobiaceae bacterium]|nr:sugar transferase [Chlorobiaceae bacterium]
MIQKRLLDIAGSVIGLIIFSPVLVAVAIVVRLTSPGPVLFMQSRVGRHGRLFRCIKFRTMIVDAHEQGSITAHGDSRITRVGRALRRYKLDELPQLWNVLAGNMSLVGPRPDVPGYADQLTGEDRRILDLLPGITGPATILFRNEERLISMAENKKAFNDEVIYPEKMRINREYMETCTVFRDVGYIVATILPSFSSFIGLDRLLGLDIEAFHKRMQHEAMRYA